MAPASFLLTLSTDKNCFGIDGAMLIITEYGYLTCIVSVVPKSSVTAWTLTSPRAGSVRYVPHVFFVFTCAACDDSDF